MPMRFGQFEPLRTIHDEAGGGRDRRPELGRGASAASRRCSPPRSGPYGYWRKCTSRPCPEAGHGPAGREAVALAVRRIYVVTGRVRPYLQLG